MKRDPRNHEEKISVILDIVQDLDEKIDNLLAKSCSDESHCVFCGEDIVYFVQHDDVKIGFCEGHTPEKWDEADEETEPKS